MSGNGSLNAARKAKDDEFYTQYGDVEAELSYYRGHFAGKSVYCNCDDPGWSAFWQYFHLNFSCLGLGRLTATCFRKGGRGYGMHYAGGHDGDIQAGQRFRLEGDGDFRSPECLGILDACDVAVTNPPFSLFREYVKVVIGHGKGFLTVGNMNSIAHKEVFPLFRDGRAWSGHTFLKRFLRPDGSLQAFGNVMWYTDLDTRERHEPIPLYRRYADDPSRYPKYDNYDAINVDRVADIPMDYSGVMGVPVTFMHRHCPEQFGIVGILQSSTEEEAGMPILQRYDSFLEMRQGMVPTGASGRKADGHPVLAGMPRKGNFLYDPVSGRCCHAAYARIAIRRKGLAL